MKPHHCHVINYRVNWSEFRPSLAQCMGAWHPHIILPEFWIISLHDIYPVFLLGLRRRSTRAMIFEPCDCKKNDAAGSGCSFAVFRFCSVMRLVAQITTDTYCDNETIDSVMQSIMSKNLKYNKLRLNAQQSSRSTLRAPFLEGNIPLQELC